MLITMQLERLPVPVLQNLEPRLVSFVLLLWHINVSEKLPVPVLLNLEPRLVSLCCYCDISMCQRGCLCLYCRTWSKGWYLCVVIVTYQCVREAACACIAELGAKVGIFVLLLWHINVSKRLPVPVLLNLEARLVSLCCYCDISLCQRGCLCLYCRTWSQGWYLCVVIVTYQCVGEAACACIAGLGAKVGIFVLLLWHINVSERLPVPVLLNLEARLVSLCCYCDIPMCQRGCLCLYCWTWSQGWYLCVVIVTYQCDREAPCACIAELGAKVGIFVLLLWHINVSEKLPVPVLLNLEPRLVSLCCYCDISMCQRGCLCLYCRTWSKGLYLCVVIVTYQCVREAACVLLNLEPRLQCWTLPVVGQWPKKLIWATKFFISVAQTHL